MPEVECKCPYCGKPITFKLLTEDEKELEEFNQVIREVERLNPSRAYDLLMDYAKKTDKKNNTDRSARLFTVWLGTRAKQNMKIKPELAEENEEEK